MLLMCCLEGPAQVGSGGQLLLQLVLMRACSPLMLLEQVPTLVGTVRIALHACIFASIVLQCMHAFCFRCIAVHACMQLGSIVCFSGGVLLRQEQESGESHVFL